MPQRFHVAGMNCVQPIAPAFDGPMLQPKPDSISVIAAMTDQRRPKALPAAFHVGTSCGAPWQRAAAPRPVRTCGRDLPTLAWAASARSEAPAVAGIGALGTRWGAGAGGAPRLALRKVVFSQPVRWSTRSAVTLSRPVPQTSRSRV